MADYGGLPPEEVLERIAKTLKKDIGPAVGDAYPKTQAFMASVVLQKIAGQIRLADAHAAADTRVLQQLFSELGRVNGVDNMPLSLQTAVKTLGKNLDTAGVSAVIRALYATRSELGEKRFSEMMACVRARLRSRVNREMSYSA